MSRSRTPDRAFRRRRAAGFGLLATAFMVAFFHRVAPAAIAEDLLRDFAVGAVALGTLSAMYYYIYTAMQIPAGILVDRLGPRLSVAGGSLVAAAGTLLFAAAPGFTAASVGRLVVGLGVATAFVGLMKYNASWFEARYYGLLSGLVVLLGNVGSVFGAAPLAYLLHWLSWREALAGIGLLSLALAALVFLVVRDDPAHAGFVERNYLPPMTRDHWLRELRDVALNRAVWPHAIALFTVIGGFFTFTGLWAVPYLGDVFGVARQQASEYISIALVLFAVGGFAGGWLSDHLGRRKPVAVATAAATLVIWLATLLLSWRPGVSGLLLFAGHGFAASAMVVCYAAAKESVRPHTAGMAIAFVNTGLFLGAALLQPAFGALLELGWDGTVRGGAPVYAASDYARGLWLLCAAAAIGLVATLCIRETYCGRSVPDEAATARIESRRPG